MKFSEIVAKLDGVVESSLTAFPDRDPEMMGMAAVEEAQPGNLSFISGDRYASNLKITQATALILPPDAKLQAAANDREIAWVSVKDPRLAFAQGIGVFYRPYRPAPGIHPTAVIDPSVELGQEVSIGAHAVIEAGVKLGDRVCIHPNVVVYPDAKIGDNTILHANCTIHERSQIGANCVIHSGAVIGAEGFGFVPTRTGWYKMEQSGHVILEDGVEIGCNSAVDRPSVGTTHIGRNTKIDNLVQIAHGCQIGSNSAFAGQVGLAGKVTVGNNVLLAGQVGIANEAKIGDGAIATAQSGILHDVGPGEVVMGYPAVAHKTFLKVGSLYNRLPEMYQTVKRLQRKIEGTSRGESEDPKG